MGGFLKKKKRSPPRRVLWGGAQRGGGGGTHIPQHFRQGGTNAFVPPNFCHQVQFFYFFLLPEVSDNKSEVDGGEGTRLPIIFARRDINAYP